MPDNQINYDSEPVEYCSKCYSLRIKHEDAIDADYCTECGSTEISTTDIDTWERLYEQRYGKRYVERNNDPRCSIYFKMPLDRLKAKVFYSKMLDRILYSLYPRFPKGLSREDAVILLFDKLSKDNRMDDLRLCLYGIYGNNIRI